MAVTPVFICGAECGLATAGTAGVGTEHWSAASGSVSVVTSGPSTMRSARCFRFNPAGVQANLTHVFETAIASPAIAVGRGYIYFTTLPNIDCNLFMVNGGSQGVAFKVSDSTIRAGNGATFGATGVVVTTGQWYRLDWKWNLTGPTWAMDLKVDGTDCGTYSVTSGSSSCTGIKFGTTFNVTADWYVDDIIMSGTSADFPIGAGTCVGLYPNGDGSHTYSAAGDFQKGAGGNTNLATPSTAETTSWQSLAKPLSTSIGSNFLRDAAGASTEFLEFVFEDTPSDVASINGLIAVTCNHAAGTSGCTITGTVIDGGSSIDVYTLADFSESTIVTADKMYATAPSTGSAWTKTKVDAIKFQWGYSTDNTPDPLLDGVCFEVDYVQTAAGHSQAASTATESDSSLALSKVKGDGIATSTSNAIALGMKKTLGVGIAATSVVAPPIGRTKNKAIGIAVEIDSCQILSKSKGTLTATETDSAVASTRIKSRALGIANEAEAAQSVAFVVIPTAPLPGASSWLDAADPDYVVSSGGVASRWKDKINSANDVTASGTAQPTTGQTIKGLNALQFDGVNDAMSFSGAGLDLMRNLSGATVYVLLKNTAAGSGTVRRPFWWSTTANNAARAGGEIDRTSQNFGGTGRRLDSDVIGERKRNDGVFQNVVKAFCWTFDWGNAQLSIRDEDDNDGGSTGTFQTAGSTSNTASNNAAIGGNTVSGEWWQGLIGEVLIYPVVHTPAERQYNMAYLKQKWITTGIRNSITKAIEADSALTLNRAKILSVGVANTAASALTVSRLKSRLVGISSTTGAALAIGSLKTKTVGTAFETDAAFATVRTKTRALGLVSSNNIAITITVTTGGGPQTQVVTTATESNAAVALSRLKTRSVGISESASAAIDVSRIKIRAITSTLETDVARALTKIKSISVATETNTSRLIDMAKGVLVATSTNTAIALARIKTKTVGVANGTETSMAISRTKTKAATLATETDTSGALARIKTRSVTLAQDTEVALVLNRTKTKTLGQASESDASQIINKTGAHAVGPAAETDTSDTLTDRKTRTVSLASSTSTARPLNRIKIVTVGIAAETDVAPALTSAKRKDVGMATSTAQAQALTRTRGLQVDTATSTEVALAVAYLLRKAAGTAVETDTALTIQKLIVELFPLLVSVAAIRGMSVSALGPDVSASLVEGAGVQCLPPDVEV